MIELPLGQTAASDLGRGRETELPVGEFLESTIRMHACFPFVPRHGEGACSMVRSSDNGHGSLGSQASDAPGERGFEA